MKLVPLGVRGSTVAAGAEFVRYGGHTSCVAVLADGDPVPRVVLDAGTGLRHLHRVLPPSAGGAYRGPIVLTHLHWDHVQGVPFSRAVDHPEAEVVMFVPVRAGGDARATLARGFSPPSFPIGPEGLLGSWSFRPLGPGPVPLPGVDVCVAAVRHKGEPTFGVRVDLDGTSLAYLPDHALGPEPDVAALALARGADVLLHDAQFVAGEEDRACAYGHATVPEALRFADAAGVGELVLTHHGPDRTDDELDRLAAVVQRTPAGRRVRFARQDEPIAVARA